MRSLIAAVCGLVAAPALATGIEITVAGEAEGVIVIDLFEEAAHRPCRADHRTGRGGRL